MGRVRNAWQAAMWRDEIVSVFASDMVLPAEPKGPDLRVEIIHSVEQLAPYVPALDNAYFPGFSEGWRAPFSWGETLVLALVDDDVCGFRWFQTGSSRGPKCHYARLFPHEYRIVRGGVLPQWRGRGVHARFHWLLIRELMSRGATRIYIDCSKDNTVSHKAQIRAGYKPAMEIRTFNLLFSGQFVVLKRALDYSSSD